MNEIEVISFPLFFKVLIVLGASFLVMISGYSIDQVLGEAYREFHERQ